MTVEELAQLILHFVQAHTWVESRQMVLDNPILLSDETQQLMFFLTDQARTEGEDWYRTFLEHQQLLQDCRVKGIDATFDDKIRQVMASGNQTLEAIFQEIAQMPLTLDQIPRRVTLCEQALTLIDEQSQLQLWAMVQGELANSYAQTPQGERRHNMEKAIHYYGQILSYFTNEDFPLEWALTQQNLGNAYMDRIAGNRADNLEKAIQYYRQSLTVRNRDIIGQDWAMTQNNLGRAYRERLKGERADNLEQSIYHHQQALLVYDADTFPKDWANTQNNLGIAHGDRIKGNYRDNIEQSIHHFEQMLTVLDIQKKWPAIWAMAQHNLGRAYSNRLVGEQAKNLEKAISYYKQSLLVRTRALFPEEWAHVHHNLAGVYLERVEGNREQNVETAIAYYQQVLSVHTYEAFPLSWAMAQNSIAVVYTYHIRHSHPENIDLAITHYQNALSVYQTGIFPQHHLQTQRNLGRLLFEEQHWQAAQTALQSAIDAGQTLFASAYTETGRRAELVETAMLYGQSVYCLTQLGEYAHAFTQLEQGKTRLLSEALSLSDTNLQLLETEEKQVIFHHRDTLRLLEAEMRLPSDTPSRRSEQKLAQELEATRGYLKQFLHDLQRRYPEFMPQGLPLTEMLTLIPKGGALVAPFLTDQGGGVFIVPHGTQVMTQVHFLLLPTLTTETLDSLLLGTDEEPGWLRYYTNSQSNKGGEDWFNAIPAFTQQLWSQVVAPIHAHLAQYQLAKGAPLIILPQGRLGLLPLHAAWREVDGQPRAWLDEYTIQYASSGYALRTSQRRVMTHHDKTPSLLGLINPTEDLPTTPFEGQLVSELFDPSAREVVSGGGVTAERLTKQAPHYQYLHFSGHGFYNWDDVMQSGLTLAKGEQFTLTDILTQLNLRQTRLVTLSACETGMTDIRQTPDEFIGLPTALMQAGAGGVVSTLWAVADFATTLLMTEFYRAHLQEQMPLPVALRHAQQWTRDLTNAEVADYAEGYYKQDKNNPLLFKIYRQAQYRLKKEGAEAYPFRNPFYWAAFTYYGA